TQNGAIHDGGGIFNAATATTTTNGGNLSDNPAGWQGGGIFNAEGAVNILEHSKLIGNSAIAGGGIYNEFFPALDANGAPDYGRDKVTINFSDLFKNTAVEYGGGIFNEGRLEINGQSNLDGNIASREGGAIFNDANAKATVTSSFLSGNRALDGAGISNKG